MAARGGKRPNAGRKAKAQKFERPIAAAEKRIADKLPALIDNMLTLANGVVVQEVEESGVHVYQKPPDRQANEYLINRILGKPTERVEAETEVSGGLKIIVEYADRDPSDPAPPA